MKANYFNILDNIYNEALDDDFDTDSLEIFNDELELILKGKKDQQNEIESIKLAKPSKLSKLTKLKSIESIQCNKTGNYCRSENEDYPLFCIKYHKTKMTQTTNSIQFIHKIQKYPFE
jgi:hypothetical protein